MGKSFSFESALILFFITVKFCSAHSASSATHQPFPENEGKPENENLGKPSILPTFEEKPPVQMVKRPNFLLIPFLKNLFPVTKNKPEPQRPTLKPIPFVKNPRFLPFPKFTRPIPKPFPAMKEPIPKFVSEPVPVIEKPFPEFEKPISEPVPAMGKPSPEFEEPISEPVPPMDKQIPSAQKLITDNEKSIPISKKDSILPKLAHTMDPESLKLKEYLFKKHFPKIPFPPKFEKSLPAH